MAKHSQKVLAVGGMNGEVELLENLFEELGDEPIDAVTLVGDLGAPWSKADTYRALFKALGHADLAAFWIPGPNDAPLGDYLRESYNMEIAYPKLRGVHGTAAMGPDHVLFAGMGGEIVDDPDTVRAEEALHPVSRLGGRVSLEGGWRVQGLREGVPLHDATCAQGVARARERGARRAHQHATGRAS